jgi:hypothetical protein
MKTKTLRLPDELVGAVREVGSAERVEESAAMRKLLSLGYERYLAERYQAGHLTLRELAGRLHTSLSDALDLLHRLGVSGNVSAADTLASLQSLAPTQDDE